MDSSDRQEISIKKEPLEGEDEARTGTDVVSTDISAAVPTTTAPIRYVSRRGRPPGGGYSMKAPTHYVRFSSTPLTGGSSSSSSGSSDTTSGVSDLSPQRIMQLAGGATSESLELGRFGIHPSFDAEKNSFRCEGCDVVFSSRDTYAMHMLLRAKNESCVALPTSAISANPENPTPREKFERELRQKAMITALRSQAEAMSKAAAALLPKSLLQETVPPQSSALVNAATPVTLPSIKDEVSRSGIRSSNNGSSSFSDMAGRSLGFNSLLALDAYSLYVDPSQYRRFLVDYGLQASSSAATLNNSALTAMMEQFACGVCGELFGNKDALAMHMMFHTREDGEGEDLKSKLRLRAPWTPDSSTLPSGTSLLMGPSGLCTSVSKSSSVPETNNNSMNDSERGGKKREERQLTAERVAELKRMAIESSLKKPTIESIPGSFGTSSQRSRSVIEDSTVTSTAQPRPLSADDARRLGMSSVPRESYDLGKPTRCWSSDTRPYRKRHSSNRDSYLNPARTLRNDMCPRKIGRWGSSKFPCDQKGPRSFKVCDNHVSSATGPQDSDETSEESPNETNQTHDPKSYFSAEGRDLYGRNEKGFPYLDAIMSQEAELVPVDGLETEKDSEDGEETVNQRCKSLGSGEDAQRSNTNSEETASAIDFSLGTQRKLRNGSEYSGIDRYLGQNGGFLFGPNNRNFSQLYGHSSREAQRSSVSPKFPYDTGTTFSSTMSTQSAAPHTTDSPLPGPSSRVGEARYCPHCEILFLDVTLFHLHMGLHNVNNPWQCNTCGLACSGRLEFNTHVLHY
ncbi:Zinc finger protein 423-like [Plakobranchus ocellatus]|uniref:Zinc finger protein 423-like n=1 Tax=Plakobranchus ocellatus TaxID=259542 RepID=A0AAV3YPE3_9GAST|nr:Zinc finger protein 423-like [Plakobranchus ocellatus]